MFLYDVLWNLAGCIDPVIRSCHQNVGHPFIQNKAEFFTRKLYFQGLREYHRCFDMIYYETNVSCWTSPCFWVGFRSKAGFSIGRPAAPVIVFHVNALVLHNQQCHACISSFCLHCVSSFCLHSREENISGSTFNQVAGLFPLTRTLKRNACSWMIMITLDAHCNIWTPSNITALRRHRWDAKTLLKLFHKLCSEGPFLATTC